MSFVQREIDRLNIELTSAPDGPRYTELYAAQQALVWSLEPLGFKPPSAMIMGTQAAPGDYLAESRPAQSSSMGAPDA